MTSLGLLMMNSGEPMAGSGRCFRMSGKAKGMSPSESFEAQFGHAVGAVNDRCAQRGRAGQDVLGVEARRRDLGAHEVLVSLQGVFRGDQRAGELPASHQVARQHQVGHRAGVGGVRLDLGRAGDEVHHREEVLARGAQRLQHRAGGGTVALGELAFGHFDLAGDAARQLAAVPRGLAADEVVGLDGGGAFVDGQDLGVAVVLRRTGLLDEAHATVHLHAQARDLQAHLGAVALHERHHEVVEGLVLLAGVGVGVVMRGIEGRGGGAGHRTAAFGQGAHRHQHAAHVGMVNDGRAAGLGAVHRAGLHAVLRIRHGLLVGPVGDAHALQADAVAGRVHHDEHVLQAAVLFADQLADGAPMVAELQHGGRAGLDAHLVLDGHAMRIVAGTERAVGVDEELRHDEQADALHALRRAGDAGQHEVDDVVGHVVLTVGDEDLGAEDLVAAIRLRLGARAHQGQVGTGLRLGEVHRARPAAFQQRRDEGGLLLGAAGGQQCLDGTVGQQRAQRKAHVGRLQHLVAGRGDGLGRALAAEVGRVLQALPAALGVGTERVLEARRRRDLAVLPERGALVAFPVQRGNDVLGQLGALFQHGTGRVEAKVGECGDLLGQRLQASEVLDVEEHVLDGGLVTHFFLQADTKRAPQRPQSGAPGAVCAWLRACSRVPARP
mmetsp:Transcript_42313/g.99245  ORF Transcript_42313/g.99245 Transcript_42313/m.99245 type:complete len:666 (-) Transcript_42313:1086-3083(-)